MTSVATLAARDHVECGHILVLQGVPWILTDREELAGTGVTSWIGTGYGPRRVVCGLDLRGTKVTYATELAEGRPETGDSLSFKVLDMDSELISFFAAQAGTPVGGRLGPKDDPAPANLIGTSGDNVPIWGKWVNSESIGPAGERSYYSLLPGGDGFGQDHAAYSGDTKTLAPSYVYDAPTHLDGRRCALYRIYYDHDAERWPNWLDQYNSGESLIWAGTLTSDIKVKGREWTLKADGPSAWLRKMIGANRPSEWLPVSGTITLSTTPGEREDLFALPGFNYRQVNQPASELGGASNFTAVDVLPSSGTAADFRSAINARIAIVSAAAGVDITWTTNRNAECSLENGYVETRIDQLPEAANFVRAAVWRLICHSKVWRAMGFDPKAQAATNFESDLEIKFTPGANTGLPMPGPGYWQAEFWTVPVGYTSINEAGEDADNSGKFRRYKAIAPQDIAQLPSKAGVEISLGIGSPVYFEAPTNRAPVEHTLSNGGGACNAQGMVAFRGSYQEQGQEEPTVNVQLARICWNADSVTLGGDTIGLDDDDHARVFVANYLDPRFYGIDRKRLTTTWAAPDLEYCPVNFLGCGFGSGDLAHRVLLKLMLSTGGAEWAGYDGEGAVLTPGANHPAALNGLEPYSDSDIADMGLAIPHALIDLSTWAKATASLPHGGINSPLNRCSYAWVGGTDSQALIASLLDARGFGLGFCRGQWRLWSRAEVLTDDEVEVTISSNDVIGDERFIETANIRAFTPRESFKVTFDKALVSEGATDDRDLTFKVQARDASRNSRRDNGSQEVDGWGLAPLPLWRGENPPDDWRAAWATLFGEDMANWFNSPQILIEGLPVSPEKARELGVGSVVRLTSLYAPNREGSYGLTSKLGRVYKYELDLVSRAATVDILVQPGSSLDTRLFAPIAVVVDNASTVEARLDTATRTFFVKADAFGHGEDLHDCNYFQEPGWTGIGGDALVYGYTWTGRKWTQAFEFLVESVDAALDTITYQAGSFSGAFTDSAYTVLCLAPPDDQPADSWTRSFFQVLTKFDFTWGAGPTQGYPLSP